VFSSETFKVSNVKGAQKLHQKASNIKEFEISETKNQIKTK